MSGLDKDARPCPWCGRPGLIIDFDHLTDLSAAGCPACNIYFYSYSEQSAIDIWNDRYTKPTSDVRRPY